MASVSQSQATTISNTAETTIVTANAGASNLLEQLIVTTVDAAIATLTLRDSTAGTTRAIFDYPNAASAPGVPFVVNFSPPLYQAVNAAWTLQASANATSMHVLAVYTLN